MLCIRGFTLIIKIDILLFIQSKSRIKINENIIDRTDIEIVVPQGSVLGPILFIANLTDLFYGCRDSNVASYADDTPPYLCVIDIPSVALEFCN